MRELTPQPQGIPPKNNGQSQSDALALYSELETFITNERITSDSDLRKIFTDSITLEQEEAGEKTILQKIVEHVGFYQDIDKDADYIAWENARNSYFAGRKKFEGRKRN